MTADRTLRLTIVLASAFALTACGRTPPPEYPTWAPTPVTYVPTGDKDAFDIYVTAAQNVEATAGKHLERVSFFPGQKLTAMQAIAGSFSKVKAATARPAKFQFNPTKPFTVANNLRGWRLLGRAFQWKVEDAIKAGDFRSAVDHAVAGTRFGFDLTGGGALEASLGLHIADDLRRTIAPAMKDMQSGELVALSTGMSKALERKRSMQDVILNEHQNMKLAVQFVQEAYKTGSYKALEEGLGATAKDGIDYLKNLKKNDAEERGPYFRGFAAEAEETARALQRQASLPAIARTEETEPKLAEHRPWRRLARHFFATGVPLLQLHDETLAKTRLLILTADLMAQGKRNAAINARRYPPNLTKYPAQLRTDPYTGQPFIYRSDPAQFLLYSVGANFKDDLGNTDETFSSPDLRLEDQV